MQNQLLALLEAIVAEVDGPGRPYSADSYLPPLFIERAKKLIRYQHERHDLRTSIRVQYEPADSLQPLTLEVCFRHNEDDGFHDVSAFLVDSRQDIADLLDFEVLCELVDAACQEEAAIDDYNHAGEVLAQQELYA